MDSEQEQIFTVAGFSMEPLLRNGDRVRLQRTARTEIMPGDIVAFNDEADVHVIHRVTAIAPYLITQGDNNLRPDPILKPDIPLARLQDVERKGKFFVPKQGRAGVKVFYRHQVRMKLFRWRNKLGRLVCRLLPYKIEETHLKSVLFGPTAVYYWRNHTVGTYWQGEWRWLWWPGAFFIRKPRKIRPIPIAGLLGAIVAERGDEFLKTMTPEQQLSCCESGRRFGFAPFIYYALSERLPVAIKEQFQLEYYARRAWEINSRMTMDMVAQKLSERSIPFIWLKGGFLAYNVYPAACTRYMRDLDFLVKREDAERVFDLFIAEGWVPRERDMRRKRSLFYRHHLPALNREGFPELELHWHIFKDVSTDSAKLWEYAQPTGRGSEYRLCPEMCCLLAVYNCYIDTWEYALRSILDLALLQKKFTIDQQLLQRLNTEFKLNIDPGITHAAFPEFFGNTEKLFNTQISTEVIAAIRSLAVNDRSNRVSTGVDQETDTLLNTVKTKIFQKIHPKWYKYLDFNRGAKRDRQLLVKKLPRFSELRQEARQSHGRF